MKLSAPLVAIAGLASMALAAPAPAPAPVVVDERDPNWAQCWWNSGGGTNFLIKGGGSWISDGGSSLVNNIGNQCGWDRIRDWNPWWTDFGLETTFWLTDGWPDKCVENSIWLASSATGAIGGVTCIWTASLPY